MKKYIMFLTFIISLLTACNSAEDELREHLICAIASKEIGDYKGFETVQAKLEKFQNYQTLRNKDVFAMEIVDDVKKELGLHDAGDMKLFKILKAYNSSVCQDLHEGETISPSSFFYYLIYLFL